MRTVAADFIPSTAIGQKINSKSYQSKDNSNHTISTHDEALPKANYRESIVNLHENIRKACQELSNRDNNVKEDLEILALERSRLGYLREELARRAAMIADWERRAKGGSSDLTDMPPPSSQKEIDKLNALRLELDIRKRREEEGYSSANSSVTADSVPRNQQPEEFLLPGPVNTPPNDRRSFGIPGFNLINMTPSENSLANNSSAPTPGLYEERRVVSSSEEVRVVSSSPASSSEEVRVASSFPASSSEEVRIAPSNRQSPIYHAVSLAEDSLPERTSPKPFPYSEKEASKFHKELTLCLDKLWIEYSTSVSEEIGQEVRLMTLPNLIRLCGDADFGVPISDVISVFLSILRVSETPVKLIEQRYFMVLLQSIFAKLTNVAANPRVQDQIQLTEKLFIEYLLPLSQRMRLQERSLSYKHPPLGKSPIASLNRRFKYSN